MFIPLGKGSTKVHLEAKQRVWILSLWPGSIKEEANLSFLPSGGLYTFDPEMC